MLCAKNRIKRLNLPPRMWDLNKYHVPRKLFQKLPAPPPQAVTKYSQQKQTHLRRNLPPLTPQKKRKPEHSDKLFTQNSPKTPKMNQKVEPQSKKNCQAKNICQPKPKISQKVWNEFTKIDGKVILLKTIDIGLTKSSRKPKLSEIYKSSLGGGTAEMKARVKKILEQGKGLWD